MFVCARTYARVCKREWRERERERERVERSKEQKTVLKKSYFLIFQLQKPPQSQGRGQCTAGRYNKICLLWSKLGKN